MRSNIRLTFITVLPLLHHLKPVSRPSGRAVGLAAALCELLALLAESLHERGGFRDDAVVGGVNSQVLPDLHRPEVRPVHRPEVAELRSVRGPRLASERHRASTRGPQRTRTPKSRKSRRAKRRDRVARAGDSWLRAGIPRGIVGVDPREGTLESPCALPTPGSSARNCLWPWAVLRAWPVRPPMDR